MLHKKHNFDIFNAQNNGTLETKNEFDEFLKGTDKEILSENQLRLPNGNIITFNKEQLEGIKKIKNWLESDKIFFVLVGRSGSGKTTSVKKVLDDFQGKVIVSAAMHKAKRVIMETTQCKGTTTQSLVGLRANVDLSGFSPNNPIFSPIAPSKIGNYDLIINDESQMIPESLYNLLLNEATNTRTKILFLGDPSQTPPIGEALSKIFTQTDFEIHWLTKSERQNQRNPLLIDCENLRNNLDDKDSGIKRITKLNEFGEGIIYIDDKNKFKKDIVNKFTSEEFKKDDKFCKIIAWRNDTVIEYNKFVKEIIFGKNRDIVDINYPLMCYNTVTSSNIKFNIVENSIDYKVIKRSRRKKNSYDIMGYDATLREELPNNDYKLQDVFIVDTNDRDNLHLFSDMNDFYVSLGVKNKKDWSKYYEFRRKNMLMQDIFHYNNGQLRENRDKIYKDFDMAYSITIHKITGTTLKHVFLDEVDIDYNFNIRERNILKYVGISRPEISATVLTNKLDE